MITNQDLHNVITTEFKRFKRGRTCRDARMKFAEELTEKYFAEREEMPSTSVLDRLGTLILQDELADMHPDKMARNEYPLLSDSQADERYKDERSIKAAQDVATDGQDYRVKTRDSNRKLRELFG